MRAIPDPWAAVILTLGVFRLARLVGWDAFPPVARMRDRLLRTTVDRSVTERRPSGAPPPVRFGRPALAAALQCPYCGGFWIGLVAWGLWILVPVGVLVVLAPFALNGAVGIVSRMLDP